MDVRGAKALRQRLAQGPVTEIVFSSRTKGGEAMTTLTIADRVDDLQVSLHACVKALERVKVIERELAEIRKTLEQAAEVAYNITIYDPAHERREED